MRGIKMFGRYPNKCSGFAWICLFFFFIIALVLYISVELIRFKVAAWSEFICAFVSLHIVGWKTRILQILVHTHNLSTISFYRTSHSLSNVVCLCVCVCECVFCIQNVLYVTTRSLGWFCAPQKDDDDDNGTIDNGRGWYNNKKK